MVFYSLAFLLFVALLLAVYYAVGKFAKRGQWVVLLVGSLAFYAVCGWQNLFFILLTATSVWLTGFYFTSADEKCKAECAEIKDRKQKKAVKKAYTRKKWAVTLLVLVVNFGVLSYIKYWNVILESIGQGDSFLASHLLLPLGLSFYTFMAVGYLIDTYQGKYPPERNYFKFLLFVSYFPQLIQGPINRFDALAHQLYERHSFNMHGARQGVLLIGYGVFKKYAIADVLALTVSSILDNITGTTPGSVIVFGILLYSAQQYADFSGGIDIVRGVSKLFGIEMAVNFRQPYFSTSLADFWRRWHITLGAWMRDYVFYPFALRPTCQRFIKWATPRMGTHFGRILPACLANILVFFLVGLWHGAEAHYILWGLYNGIVIALADLCMPLFNRINEKLHIDVEGMPHRIWCIVRTFIVVNIGWYFDRIFSFSDCMQAFYNTFFNFELGKFASSMSALGIGHLKLCLFVAALGCVIVFVISVLRERKIDVTEKFLALNPVIRCLVYVVCASLVLVAFMIAPAAKGFMYANF